MTVRQLSNLSPSERGRADALGHLFDLLHWGVPSRRVFEVADPLVPDCVQMGGLEALRVLMGGREYEVPYEGHLGVEYDLPALYAGLDVHRLFDADRLQRLHLIAPTDLVSHHALVRAAGKGGTRSLTEIAQAAGGRQARFSYPNVQALPIAPVTHIVYGTEKKGDGYSHYIHKFSEETGGPRPWLAIDTEGRSWLLGGSYTVPPEGITD